jgi:probable F420-dependent oxidoreductase
VKFGAIFPTTELGSDPIAIRDWAQAAEQLGYNHILTYDHVLGSIHEGRDPALTGPYTEQDAFHEPFVLFGYLAGQTTKVELVTGILILPQRQTALVAKQAAEVDLLSGGRLRLGIGTGWNWVEYDALGVGYADRGARMDEQIELLRKLWSEPTVDFAGKHHRVDRAGILPQPQKIPIWMGGFSEVAVRRAARVGDGFLFGTLPTRVLPLYERFHELLEEQGRSRDEIVTEAVIDFSDSPDVWESEVEAWRKAGGTQLSLRAMDTAAEFVGAAHVGFEGPKSYIDALETFSELID